MWGKSKTKERSAAYQRMMAWAMLAVGVISVLSDVMAGRLLNPLMFMWLVLSVWLVISKDLFFGLATSTQKLMQEERASRKVTAMEAHLPFLKKHTKQRKDAEAGRVIGYLALALVASIAVGYIAFSAVDNSIERTLVYLGLFLIALWYALEYQKKALTFLIVTSIFILFGFSEPALFAVMAAGIFTFGICWLAWKEENWDLFLLSEMGGYVSLSYWISRYADVDTTNVTVFMALIMEILLVFVLFFALPFVNRRRKASNRETVRSIVLLNGVAFTFLASWISYLILPENHLLSFGAVLMLLGLCAALSYENYGRESHFKYYATAFIASILIGSMIVFSAPVVCMVWFICAIIALTAGFVWESWSGRLVGLFCATGAFIYYLFSVLPDETLDTTVIMSKAWIGLMLAGFISVTAAWYQDPKLKGPDRENRLTITSALLTAAGILIICVGWLGVVHFTS